MLQLKNSTQFKASMALFPNEDGVDTVYGVVKATFSVTSTGVVLAPEQLPVVMADAFWGDPKESSLKQASEVGLTKLSTDVLLSGFAYSTPRNRRIGEVRLQVGSVSKTAAVFGDRRWEKVSTGWRISDPEPFEKIPLKYELAYGGADSMTQGSAKAEYEARNPVGRGFVSKGGSSLRPGDPLPNFEDPNQPIRSPKDRPTPCGFGPICAHWEPRKSRAGTYDAAWQKKRAPYLPQDFDRRFHQVASPDLVAASYLEGGESVELSGATPGKPWRFVLPRLPVQIVFQYQGKPFEPKTALDTIWLDPEENRFCLLWRASHVVDKFPHRLESVEIRCSEGKSEGGDS